MRGKSLALKYLLSGRTDVRCSMGSAATGRSGLYRKVSKTDIQEYCGEYTPIELRMLEAWVLKNGSMKSE